MKRNVLILLSVVCLILSSCGKDFSFEKGNTTSDFDIIENGVFTGMVIKHEPYLDYYCTDALYGSDNKYYYLIKNNSDPDILCVSFDQNGNSFSDISLNLPFSLSGQMIISDGYSDLLDLDGAEGLHLFYYDPTFSDNGFIEGFCTINGIMNHEDSMTEYITKDYKIIWNMDGTIKSVDNFQLEFDMVENLVVTSYKSYDKEGKLFTITDSGIVRSDHDGSFSDIYCDFINSSISEDISDIVYGGESGFSALIHDRDNNSIAFSVYSRGNQNINVTPISIYCSSLSDDVKNQIITFNANQTDYRIGVRNFSDFVRDYTVEYPDYDELNDLALDSLEEAIISGNIPDIIYENSGIDKVFLKQISDNGRLVDLKDALKKDDLLKDNKFLPNLYDLSDEDGVYAFVPSFTFDTYVAAVTNENIRNDWSLDDYVNIKNQSEPGLVMMDSYTSEDFMRKVLAFNGDAWIDISNGNVSIGNDLKTYLELAAELPATNEEFDELSMTGQIPVNIQCFYSPITNIIKNYYYSSNNVSGEPSYVGFPAAKGSSSVIHPSGAFMICSDRASVQGAWEFVRSFLSEEYQNSLIDSIPVVESSFEKWKSINTFDATTMNDFVIIAGGPVIVPEVSQEVKDQLTDSVRSCDNYYFTNPDIEEIVLRNANEYFEGKISADEAKDNIEKEIRAFVSGLN